MNSQTVVRGWVRLYTWGLEPEGRDARRSEIESDLWEHRNDGAFEYGTSLITSLAILGRWAAGVPSDLSWRVTQRRYGERVRKERIMITRLARSWWQVIAALVAVFTILIGVRQFFTDEVSVGISPGKIVALIFFLGAGALTTVGLATYRINPRRGAAMVMVGVAPVAVIGGLGIGLVVGLVASLFVDLDWWWMPFAIAGTAATIAGFGAFSAWWNATLATTGRRLVLVPLSLLGVGLTVGAAGLITGLTVLALIGAMIVVTGVVTWSRRMKAAD